MKTKSIALGYQNGENGFIALISVIIISVLLLTITLGLTTINYHERFSILNREYKQHSMFLAESCVGQARYNLKNNIRYTGPVAVNNDTCFICSTSNAAIQARGIYQRSYSNISATLNTDGTIAALEELPIVATYACP